MTKPIQFRPRKSNRKSPRLEATPALKDIYNFFVKPFERAYCSQWHENTFSETVEAFFNTQSRNLSFCKASMSFTMPGGMWRAENRPYELIRGTGRRHIKTGDALVVRTDEATPNRCELEFDEQIFVLTKAEFDVIKTKLVELL